MRTNHSPVALDMGIDEAFPTASQIHKPQQARSYRGQLIEGLFRQLTPPAKDMKMIYPKQYKIRTTEKEHTFN